MNSSKSKSPFAPPTRTANYGQHLAQYQLKCSWAFHQEAPSGIVHIYVRRSWWSIWHDTSQHGWYAVGSTGTIPMNAGIPVNASIQPWSSFFLYQGIDIHVSVVVSPGTIPPYVITQPNRHPFDTGLSFV